MNATTVLRAFKPNTTLFGYASFLAVNAAGAWGGVFPLLPMKLQEPQTLFWFFLVQSLVFAACFFLSVVGSVSYTHLDVYKRQALHCARHASS